MASFARSFKPPPPGYLSPYRRPSMPARTLSNSSDLSNASGGADEAGDAVVSPLPARHDSGNSRPIAIELPTIRKPSNYSSVQTPPEPLSARGDLPGGYFPMHEDPKGRVHRPHPFHQDSRRQLSDAVQVERKEMAQPTMPVASYLAPGFHDSPLPMGKYYPSNWEQRRPARSSSDSRPSSVPRQYDNNNSTSGNNNTNHEAEARRKMMQQYQRDMIAQAAMGLGGSAKTAGKQPLSSTASPLTGLPLKDVWLAVPSSLKPASPRLHPLGSPGPVTPMDLEAAGYLDHHHHSKPYRDWPVAEHRTAAGMASHSP
ncbi:hypothetical protein L249_1794 [Ophiocordyceps polyrhachis-furcata BCC 54312]|uniref:Uncharacterized protein n=1 Tax=Ophiocordyceps polyrhachis-furcata BCC 54312 TaxID=1330021 RepID=A0A367LRI9_9HYPO|nr:hypothetical protein L249_1794 [Ophiocordyceps polyrhachis-furcata BCC 54312]